MAGKYTGFDRLKGALAKHPSKDAAMLAASKGRKKAAAMGDRKTGDKRARSY